MRRNLRVPLVATLMSTTVLAACGGSDGNGGGSPPTADAGPVPLTVPKVAACEAGDRPEAAL